MSNTINLFITAAIGFGIWKLIHDHQKVQDEKDLNDLQDYESSLEN